MTKNKIKDLAELSKMILRLRKENRKIVFTNGCFDILHYGHLRYLEEAKRLGDILIVGVNSDLSIKKIKGDFRPINKCRDRLAMVAGLQCVDYCLPFNEKTPLRIIKKIKPDILVKGGDWRKEDIIGNKFVSSYGGKVKTIRYIKGYSTTQLINKIIKNEEKRIASYNRCKHKSYRRGTACL